MRKAALHNLGCKVNAYETEAMEQLLEAADREGVEINTYSIIYDAIDDIKSAMVGMLDKKKNRHGSMPNPSNLIAAMSIHSKRL